jgi:protein-tyrosine phosphatase
MAEALLRVKALRENFEENIKVISAGIFGVEGSAPAKGAVLAMQNMDVDISGHVSKQITLDLINRADLILTMTQNHKLAVLEFAREAADKIYTLGEFAGEQSNVLDPYGHSAMVYGQVAEKIDKLLDKSWERIVTLAGKTVRDGEKT